ncbi:uncharacterized protein [Rutidosis leptorrhynchoides]|uniref:uncharacterized protein n=1 Tax=Rutidosis leptorrhynchoides TaxID=125765 RepID=UPI003A99F333
MNGTFHGSSTEFWNEAWCGSESLKNAFPRLYRLETNKNIVISGRIKQCHQHALGSGQTGCNSGTAGLHQSRDQVTNLGTYSKAEGKGESPGQYTNNHHSRVDQSGGGENNSGSNHIRFNWEWTREPTGRTAGELEELINFLKSISFEFNHQMSWKWTLASNGLFTVKTLSKLIDSEVLDSGALSTQETLRNNLVPKKIEVFIWRVLKKRLPVRIELHKRAIDLHSIRCPVCDDGLESVDHALVDCKFSSDVWSRVLKWWNSNSNINSTDLLRGKSSHTMSLLGSKIWQAMEWICAYSIWRNRNSLVFQGKSSISPVILNEIQAKSFEWISERIKCVSIDWHSWLVTPYLYVNV